MQLQTRSPKIKENYQCGSLVEVSKKKKKSKFKLNFRKNKHTFAKEKTLDVLRTSFNIHRATLTGRSFDTL